MIVSHLNSINRLAKANLIWVGFSGGVDSTVLLHALCQIGVLKSKVRALHIHHGLSERADNWANHCETVANDFGCPLLIEKVKVSNRGSLEQAARTARYSVFERHIKLRDVLVLGHHQDDQIETFMMRLMRGSGLTGLGAMAGERSLSEGDLLRPLLPFSRDNIERYAEQNHLKWIEDESNQDPNIDRNWWRNKQLPEINARYPQSRVSILKTIETLKSELSVLNDLLTPIYQKMTPLPHKLDLTALIEQPSNVQMQLIRMWVEQNNHYPLLSDKQIKQLLMDFAQSRSDAEPIFRWGENEIRRYKNELYIHKRLPKIQNYHLEVDLTDHQDKIVLLPYEPLECKRAISESALAIKPLLYQVVAYDGSLKAKPHKRPTKSLKKWFQEFNIPPWQRPYLPVFMHEDKVAAVPGVFIGDGFESVDGYLLHLGGQ